MLLQLFPGQKTLRSFNALRNFVIIDFEYGAVKKNGKDVQYIINIAAKYYSDNKVKYTFDEWLAPSGMRKEVLDNIESKIGYPITVSQNYNQYLTLFSNFYKWLSKNRLTRSTFVGWGISADVSAINTLFKDNESVVTESYANVIYDLQRTFSRELEFPSALGLTVASNIFGIKENNKHVGHEDIDLIFKVKNSIKKWTKEVRGVK